MLALFVARLALAECMHRTSKKKTAKPKPAAHAPLIDPNEPDTTTDPNALTPDTAPLTGIQNSGTRFSGVSAQLLGTGRTSGDHRTKWRERRKLVRHYISGRQPKFVARLGRTRISLSIILAADIFLPTTRETALTSNWDLCSPLTGGAGSYSFLTNSRTCRRVSSVLAGCLALEHRASVVRFRQYHRS